MSAKGQLQTFVGSKPKFARPPESGNRSVGLLEAGCSFDHLVRAGEQRRRNGSANSSGGPQVHNQLEPRRTLNWYIGGMGTFEDFVYINSDAPHDFDRVRTI